MSRIAFCAGFVVAFTMGQQVAPCAVRHLPTSWAYALTDTCRWEPQAWSWALGRPLTPVLDTAARRAERACWTRRGHMNQALLVNELLERWPTPAERAAWEAQDNARDPLPARWTVRQD